MGANPIPLQVPIGAEAEFKGVVDLINNKAIVWNEEDMGMTFKRLTFLLILLKRLNQWREKLVEAVAESDESSDGEIF